jgi:hypothetical protein
MSDLDTFWVHTVTVETYQGTTGDGTRTYAAPQQATGFLEGKRRYVRGRDGDQVISESTLYGPTTLAALFTPQSRVTLPDRATPTFVITLNTNDSAGLGLPDHVAVFLQ